MQKISDINEIIDSMTLEEKARLVNGATFFGSAGFERLGIPRMQLLDGGTGINFEQLFGDMAEYYDWSGYCGTGEIDNESVIKSTGMSHVIEYFFEPHRLSAEEEPLYRWIKSILNKRLKGRAYSPGCFPPGILLGATWNPEVVYEVGDALGVEACLYGVHILLGTPNVNIHRDPLNGRLFEGYSEDPCLVSKLAPQLVRGVQKHGVAANVKHFAANNQETNRVGINEKISKRALEEIYFPGFKACVKDGGVKTVMSAYNRINDIPCTENKQLLVDKLRAEWGFDGMVVSDWGAVYNPVRALAAGNDLAMPGPSDWKPIAAAVDNNSLNEDILDNSVRRILELIKWLGESYDVERLDEADLTELKSFTDKAAYAAACEGIVMLKNEGIFPLKQGTKVYLAGSGAESLIECGSGSAGINTDRTSSLYYYLASYLGADNVRIMHPEDMNGEELELESNSVVLCVCSLAGMEGNDRNDLKMCPEDIELLTYIEKYDLDAAVILNTCGPVDLTDIDNDNIKGIFAVFLPGMEGGHAMADILAGKINPSGKLPITFPVRYEDTPAYLNFPGDGYEVNYGEGIYVGYRYYDKKKIKPMYAFGYGLSYTDFECRLKKVEVCAANYGGKDGSREYDEKAVRIYAEVENKGNMAGSEVVQIYVGDPYSTLSKPVKELKAFSKIYLDVGECRSIDIELEYDDFASYDGDLGCWTVEEGYYDIYASVSSRDEDVFGMERIYLDVKSPYSYSADSSVKIICENAELKALAYKLWNSQGWDVGIIDNNYQYTSNRSLRQILEDVDNLQADIALKAEFIDEFNKGAANIIKK